MKKLIKLMLLAVVLLLTTTGCSTSTKSPEKLLTKPNYDEEKALLNSGISKVLYQNVNLVFPENLKESGKINYVDLDEDGKNEIVAFQKKEKINSDSKVGFLILREDKESYSFLEDGVVLEKGDKIEYGGFYDLDGDGNKEIIMQYKDPDNISRLKVYAFKDNKINLKYQLDEIFADGNIIPKLNLSPNNTDSATSLAGDIDNKKIKISYINDDNNMDMVVLGYNSSNRVLKISLVQFTSERAIVKDVKTIDDVNGISEAYITIGNISKYEKGIILDIPIGKDGAVGTEVMYVKDDKFVTVASCKDESMKKAYYVPVGDMNKDNIIDIPSIPANRSSFIDKAYAYITYYQWNGNLDENNMEIIGQSYYNYQYNFRFSVPKEMQNLLYTEQKYEGEKIQLEFKATNVKTGTLETVFTVVVKPKSGTIEDKKGLTNSKDVVQVLENEDYTYDIIINNRKILKDYGVEENKLKESFSNTYE